MFRKTSENFLNTGVQIRLVVITDIKNVAVSVNRPESACNNKKQRLTAAEYGNEPFV